MLMMSVRVGQALRIGDLEDPTRGVVIGVEHKTAQTVRLAISTAMSPIRLIPDGLFPPRYTTGITGERRRAPDTLERLAASA